MKGVLAGVKILDLTRVLAGPYTSMLFGDMGAEVIKIEKPTTGDDSRAFGPFIHGESAYYINLNRNKKGVTLNLKSERGKEIFKKMVLEADIILENYRPGTMEKLGLGYETLKKINKKLIYGCVSGFGHYGPYAQRAGYDIIGQAMGGLMSTTGWPGGNATRTGTAMADVLGGLSLATGVLAAYISTQKSGEGQKVDVALVDSVVSSLEIINQIYLVTGENPQRIGNRYESVYPYDSFLAQDGELVIGCGNDKLFILLANLMDMPELATDRRFDSNPKRVQNNKELKPYIEKWLKDKLVDDAVERMLEAGVPAAPINSIERVVNDPHIAGAREMFVELEHPVAGKMKITGNQIKFSSNKIVIKTPAPTLGQHNAEVYQQFGITPDQLKSLSEEGVF